MTKKTLKRTKRNKKYSILKEYNFEIFITFLIFFGIFLLIENIELKSFLKNTYFYIYNTIKNIIYESYHFIFKTISKIESSDIFGISLICFAVFLLIIRWRQRLITNFSFLESCRSCKDRVHRIKREKKVKIFAFIFRLKIRKYQCVNCHFKDYKINKI